MESVSCQRNKIIGGFKCTDPRSRCHHVTHMHHQAPPASLAGGDAGREQDHLPPKRSSIQAGEVNPPQSAEEAAAQYIPAIGRAREPAAAPTASIVTRGRQRETAPGVSTQPTSPHAMTPPTGHLFERPLHRRHAAAREDLGVFSKEALAHPRFARISCIATALVTARRDEVSSPHSL